MATLNRRGLCKELSRLDLSGEDDMEAESSERVRRKAVIHYEYVPKGNHRRLGLPMVEVFSVRILKIHGPGDLYGTIKIDDGMNIQYLYNRKREESEYICPGTNLLLTGPDRYISAMGDFTIKVDLMERDFYIMDRYDDGSSDGVHYRDIGDMIDWTIYQYGTNVYNHPLLNDLDSKYGSVRVNYIVFSNAVQATVNVTIKVGFGKDAAVHGKITAGNDHFSQESVLFQKAPNELIDVSPGQLIPLSRSVVAVPLYSVLRVRAALWDFYGISSNEIGNDIVEFPANISDTFEKCIYGECGEIHVKVTWTILYATKK